MEVCFVLDESGSVCSKLGGQLSLCTNSSDLSQRSACEFNDKSDKKDPDYCPKFNTHTKGFVRGYIDTLEEVAAYIGACKFLEPKILSLLGSKLHLTTFFL